MRKLLLTLLIICFGVFSGLSQTDSKYKEVDALLSTNSMTDAMTALQKLEQTFKKDTTNAAYWLRYSKASYAVYRYSEAQMALDKAIALKPQQSQYYFEKGLLLNKLKNLDSALVSLEQAVAIKPDGSYFYWKGIVNQQLNHKSAAQKDYHSAIEKGVATPELFNNYAILLLEEKRLPEALVQINRAIGLDHEYAQAYSARSKLHLYLLNVDSACVDKATAVRLGYKRVFDIPDSVCTGTKTIQLRFAGDVCAASNLYEQAIKAYSAVIAGKTDQSDVYLNRGHCYYKTKNYSQAEADYLQALKLPNPGWDLLYDNLSLLYFDQNEYSKSIEYSSKRIALNPKNPVPYIDRGLSFRKLKKYKDAETDFNAAIAIKSDFYRAFGYRAFLFLELGQLQKAYDDATEAIKLDPTYGYAYLVRAQVKQGLGVADYCLDLYQAKKSGEPEAEKAIQLHCK